MSDEELGPDDLRSHPVIYCKYGGLSGDLLTYRTNRWRGCGAILATVPTKDLARTHVESHLAKENLCKYGIHSSIVGVSCRQMDQVLLCLGSRREQGRRQ